MDSLNHDNQPNVIEAFNSTSKYLDDLLNIGNPYFECMVKHIYPPELQMHKANKILMVYTFRNLLDLLESGLQCEK